MKISELARIDKALREVEIPLAIMGENRNITLGQILDSVPQSIVPFGKVCQAPANTVIAHTSAPPIGSVVFDTDSQKFYFAAVSADIATGTVIVTYYTSWKDSGKFHDDNGAIRKDCLYRADDGQLYFFDGETLKNAGGEKSVVISSEDYESLEAPDSDTFYYIYEDE